jgi:glycosyltransferase involved in cell wall biosynthesis
MKNKVKYNPFVSIICVTFNRRPFIPFLLECIRNQDYPASRYEVIIVDDGTDKIRDLISEARMPQVKYFELAEKIKLGQKRNYSHTLLDKRSQYITYFDDDDYHHPCRISHSVEMLIKSIMCWFVKAFFLSILVKCTDSGHILRLMLQQEHLHSKWNC